MILREKNSFRDSLCIDFCRLCSYYLLVLCVLHYLPFNSICSILPSVKSSQLNLAINRIWCFQLFAAKLSSLASLACVCNGATQLYLVFSFSCGKVVITHVSLACVCNGATGLFGSLVYFCGQTVIIKDVEVVYVEVGGVLNSLQEQGVVQSKLF